MAKTVLPVIAELFLDEKSPGQSRDFAWRLVRRRGRPFLILPVVTRSTRISLELYSAQRRRAKIWRALLPLLLDSPAAMIFQRISFPVSEHSELIRFLSEQSGVPFDQLPVPAIKFGGATGQKSRLVLLVCDQTNRPLKVIKLGLDAAGRDATDREACLLEKLPANKIGCIHMTGRLTTARWSAFATDFFPGSSPEDDAGMEALFQSWINPGPTEAIETFEAWHELEDSVAKAAPAAWPVLRAALAGRCIRSTLYHGDFAPWNIRAVNSQNLRAFDWERGNLRGIPGWDWFHFVVQTAILARRQSVEQVAAEVEELLLSPRFKNYAAATGISPIVRPLLLAYLLHHRWVINPLEGSRRVEALFRLLAERWHLSPPTPAKSTGRAGAPAGIWADASAQLQAAGSQLRNVFWEPTLTAAYQPPLSVHLKSAWPLVLFCNAWLAATATAHFLCPPHVILLPAYALPCLLAAWKMNRRWGMLFACMAAALGPAVAMAKEPETHPADIVCWNTLMRLIILQLCVFLTDRIRWQQNFFNQLLAGPRRPADFGSNWAVVLLSALWFALIAYGDIFTGPRVSVLPLYLFPAILITLFLNLSWGSLVALLGALVASADEYTSKYNAHAMEVFGWNFPMRFLMLFLVLLLLDRFRQDNVLFTAIKHYGKPPAGRQG